MAITSLIILNQAKFGKLPKGERLKQIESAENYSNGSFKNLSYTPDLSEGASMPKVIWEFLFKKNPNGIPPKAIPSQKTNLLDLDSKENTLVWFGHSSYFMQIDGKKYLIDPVFSPNASPFTFTTTAFKGSNVYTTDDLPNIDYLIITHDHWDHLDYPTIMKLKNKVQHMICGLGVGAHFEHWGFDMQKVYEKNWYDKIEFEDGISLQLTPARHFSGRGLARNKSLWTSYVLKTPSLKIYIGGDSGYDTHFAKIGQEFGPFDLAIIENGQYNDNWNLIHLMPKYQLTVAHELKAKRILTVHNSKFKLAMHDWDEPLKLISENFAQSNIPLITPMIGEKVNLSDPNQKFSQWWKSLK